MQLTLSIIVHTVQLSAIAMCILYLLNKKSVHPYRLFSIGWIIILLQDLTMVAIAFYNPANNTWVYNIAFPFIQAFCMLFFILLLAQKKWMFIIWFFLLFAAINYFKWQGPIALNTMSLGLGGIIIVVLAFTELYRLYKTDSVQNFFHEPAFWISAGFILYWGFASPYFAMYNFLWNTRPKFLTIYFYSVNFGFLVLLNLSIIKALQCSLKTRKSSVSLSQPI